MFSKKMMIRTLVSLIVSLLFEKVIALPSELMKPVLLLIVIICIVGLYLYSQGFFTEEKIMETLARHQEDPLSRIHAHPEIPHHVSEKIPELTGTKIISTKVRQKNLVN